MLLCDFHIHTTYSDGSVELRRTIDLFGQAGFDAIAITDHVVNGDNPLGKLAHRFRYSVTAQNFDRYMDHIREEAERACRKAGAARMSENVVPSLIQQKKVLQFTKEDPICILLSNSPADT